MKKVKKVSKITPEYLSSMWVRSIEGMLSKKYSHQMGGTVAKEVREMACYMLQELRQNEELGVNNKTLTSVSK